jgi:hypothetical protein
MSAFKHTEIEAQLDAALWDEAQLAPADAHTLHAHLAECDLCRARYDRLALAARAITHSADSPDPQRSPGELAFGEAAFLGALDAMLAAEAPAKPAPPAIGLSAWRARRAQLGAALIALAAGALAVWGIPRGEQPLEADGFAARSAQEQPRVTPNAASQARVEVFCVTRDAAGQARFGGADEAPLGTLTCPQDAELQLAYSLAKDAARLRYAAFFGIDERGAILWYGPSPASPGPLRVEASGELEPAGETLRLSVNHVPGMVHVFGLFSFMPLELAQLESLLRSPADWRAGEGAREARQRGFVVSETSFEVVEVRR